MYLLREGILDDKGINQLEQEVEAELQAAVDRALEALPPAPEIGDAVICIRPTSIPRLSAFETQPWPEVISEGKKPAAKTMVDLINATLREEMRRDERIVVFGEDVADCSREEYLNRSWSKAKAASSKLTIGLQRRVRQRSRVQFADRRSRHRGPRDRAWRRAG